MDSRSRVSSASLAATCAARQSLGTTSKPTPGISITPATFAHASRAARSSKTSISPECRSSVRPGAEVAENGPATCRTAFIHSALPLRPCGSRGRKRGGEGPGARLARGLRRRCGRQHRGETAFDSMLGNRTSARPTVGSATAIAWIARSKPPCRTWSWLTRWTSNSTTAWTRWNGERRVRLPDQRREAVRKDVAPKAGRGPKSLFVLEAGFNKLGLHRNAFAAGSLARKLACSRRPARSRSPARGPAAGSRPAEDFVLFEEATSDR